MRTYIVVTALCLLAIVKSIPIYAQYTMGNTGLLHMPTGEMQKDGTALIGGNYLNKHNMPNSWTYNTYNYYVNITFLPFIEIAYTAHLLSFGEWGKDGKHFNNQDRAFSGRIRLLKEGQLWKHMPGITIGAYDPASGHDGGGEAIVDQSEGSHNYFARYYIAATKHAELKKWGTLGGHLAYIYSRGTGNKYKGVAIGADFRPIFHPNLDFMAEYDARHFNCGLQYNFLKYFICTFELQEFKYISAGLTLRIHLKKDKLQTK